MALVDRHQLLPHVDNPMNDEGWGDGIAIADRAGQPRKSIASRLRALEREGLVESRLIDRHGIWIDKHPRQWRLSRKGVRS